MFPASAVAIEVQISGTYTAIPGIQSWKLNVESEEEKIFTIGGSTGSVIPVANTVSVEASGYLVWDGSNINSTQRYVITSARTFRRDNFRIRLLNPTSGAEIGAITGAGYFRLTGTGGGANAKSDFGFVFTFDGAPTYTGAFA